MRKDIIELLATFTRVPSDLATKEGYYTTLEANLRLNLASNNFSVLPKELCTIQSLTQISLRNNAFSELPLALSTCPNLGTINIAQNHFRYLPFAFLKAYNCRHMIYDITFHPNPFVIPEHVKAHISAIENPQTTSLAPLHKPPLGLDIHGITGSKDGSGWLVYSFRTETRFLDAYGTRITGPIFPFDDPDGPSVTSIPAVGIDDIPTPPSVVSRAPSLSEIAIRACVKHPQLHDLPEFLPQDSPDKVKRILDLAITVNYSGSRTCSVCEKSFVVPRTEWIEWWHVKDVLLPYLGQGVWGVRDLEERHIPFMRHGCSWKCVP